MHCIPFLFNCDSLKKNHTRINDQAVSVNLRQKKKKKKSNMHQVAFQVFLAVAEWFYLAIEQTKPVSLTASTGIESRWVPTSDF